MARLGHGHPVTAPQKFYVPPVGLAFVAGPYAAPIVVVGASRKRNRIFRLQQQKLSTKLGKPQGGTPTVIVVRPKPIKVVKTYRRTVIRGNVQLGGMNGVPTLHVQPVGPEIKSQAIQRAVNRRRFGIKSKLSKPVKQTTPVTVVVRPRPLIVKLAKKKRTAGKVIRIKPVKFAATIVVVKPKPIVVKLAKVQKKIRGNVQLFGISGVPTAKPPVRPVKVVTQPKTKKIRGKVRFIRPVPLRTPVIVNVKPKPLKVISQGVRSGQNKNRFKGNGAQLSGSSGVPTTRVNPKAPKVLRQAINTALRKKRVVVHITRVRHGGGIVIGPTVNVSSGLWRTDGLTYHKNLNKPHLNPAPLVSGTYPAITIDGALTEMNSEVLTAMNYKINGDLP